MSGAQYYCPVCQIHCSGPITWNDHVVGRKHKEKERQMQLPNAPYNPAIPTDTLHTIPLQTTTPYDTTSTPSPYHVPHDAPQFDATQQQPMKRPKLQDQPFVHASDTNTMLKGGPTQLPSDAHTPQTYIPPNTKPISRNGASSSKFYCTLCQCSMNDSHAYVLHLQGKKHQQSMKTQPNRGGSGGGSGNYSHNYHNNYNNNNNVNSFSSSSSSGQSSKHTPSRARSSTLLPPFLLFSPHEDSLVQKKYQQLVPPAAQALAMAALVGDSVTALSSLTGLGVAEVKLVGSYVKGTMLCETTSADIVAIIIDIPFPSRMRALTSALQQHHSLINRTVKLEGTTIRISDNSRYSVNAMVTWVGAWEIQMGIPPPIDGTEYIADVEIGNSQLALAAVRHAIWFSEHYDEPRIKSLIRLMKYYKNHTPSWQCLSAWALEVLVDRALVHAGFTSESIAGVARCLRAVFEYVSAGVLLPRGLGLPDPCMEVLDYNMLRDDSEREAERRRVDIVSDLQDEHRDAITKNAQDALRALSLGKWDFVLNVSEPHGMATTTTATTTATTGTPISAAPTTPTTPTAATTRTTTSITEAITQGNVGGFLSSTTSGL